MRASLFKNNQTQAVRLPKALAFPEETQQVEVVKIGASRLIAPIGHIWDSFFDEGPAADFPGDRNQPAAQEREGF